MTKLFKSLALASCASVALGQAAAADDLFELRLSQFLNDNEFVSPGLDSTEFGGVFLSFNNVTAFAEAFKFEQLTITLPAYDPLSPVFGDLNLRGLAGDAVLEDFFLPETETLFSRLVFNLDDVSFTAVGEPGENVGFSEEGGVVITGENREIVAERFLDFLESGAFASEIAKTAVARTATDPVAGNPNSLLGLMGQADALSVASAAALDETGGDVDGEPRGAVPGRLSFAPSLGFFDADIANATIFTLPVQYIKPLAGGRWALVGDASFTYADTAGSNAYNGTAGISVKAPLVTRSNVKWSLVPSFRLGVIASEDIGTGAVLYSGAVASVVKTRVQNVGVTITNSYTQYASDSFEVDDFEVDYDLNAGQFRNGVSLEGDLPFNVLGRAATWQGGVAHINYTGDDQYVGQYTELTASIGTRGQARGVQYNSARVGLSVFAGENDYTGVRINLGYTF